MLLPKQQKSKCFVSVLAKSPDRRPNKTTAEAVVVVQRATSGGDGNATVEAADQSVLSGRPRISIGPASQPPLDRRSAPAMILAINLWQ
jgi:hypothetical protein